MPKKAAVPKRKAKAISSETIEAEKQMRLKIMRRYLDLENGGLRLEWGFYPMALGNLDDPVNVAHLWDKWNEICFERGCYIAHRYMLAVRHIAEESETDIKIGIMQERY